MRVGCRALGMDKSAAFLALALALLTSAGCSLASLDGGAGKNAAATPSEVAALEAQILELKRRAAVADVEIARLERRLTELEGRAERETAGASRESSRPQPPARSSGEGSIGSADAPKVEVSELPVEPVPPSRPQDGPMPSDGISGAAADPSALTESAQALYDRGYTLFHRGQYVDSESAFQQFLSGHGGTVLADNAQFWIAEARYARGDLSGARAAYLETAGRFPNGNKAPDALLKAGECSLELGEHEAARRSFAAVLEEFPGSAAAASARERIGRLP